MTDKAKRKSGSMSIVRKWWSVWLTIIVVLFAMMGHFRQVVVMPLYLLRVGNSEFWYFVFLLVTTPFIVLSLFDFAALRMSPFILRIIRVGCAVLAVCLLAISFLQQLGSEHLYVMQADSIDGNDERYILLRDITLGWGNVFLYQCDSMGIFCQLRWEDVDTWSWYAEVRAVKLEYDTENDAVGVYVNNSLYSTYPPRPPQIHITE